MGVTEGGRQEWRQRENERAHRQILESECIC